MVLSLSNLKSAKHKSKKRVGRGNASGHGTYSTRGIKGQNSRSGGGRGIRAGFNLAQHLPKLKGFKSRKAKSQVVKIDQINRNFKPGEIVSPRTLLEKKIIDKIQGDVKILGNGNLKVMDLKFQGCRFSKTVLEKIKNQSK